MAEDDDKGDLLDPKYQDYNDSTREEKVQENNTATEAFVRRRQQAYVAVFSGKGSEEDRNFVMNDLARFCRAYEPTWNTNQKVQDLLEGRREVFMRIMDFTCLDHTTLFRKYTDAATRK